MCRWAGSAPWWPICADCPGVPLLADLSRLAWERSLVGDLCRLVREHPLVADWGRLAQERRLVGDMYRLAQEHPLVANLCRLVWEFCDLHDYY